MDAFFIRGDAELQPGDELVMIFLKKFVQECSQKGSSLSMNLI